MTPPDPATTRLLLMVKCISCNRTMKQVGELDEAASEVSLDGVAPVPGVVLQCPGCRSGIIIAYQVMEGKKTDEEAD